MATISKPFTFSAGATIVAAEHNSNFDTVYNDYNGNITNVNLAAGAAIVDTKLAQLSTAAKVSGAALTSLTSVPSGAGLLPRLNGGMPIGVILPYGASSAPTGWLLCDGTAVSRTTYADLFTVLSTTFGVGDGSTTFNLPDLRQRFPIGKAASGTGSTLGGTGGTIDHVHTGPSHVHAFQTTGAAHGGANLDGASDGGRTVRLDGGRIWGIQGASSAADLDDETAAAGTGNTGTGNPPFQSVTYIVFAGV